MQAVFLDSGIFIAFMSRRDRWHAQALALFGGPRPRWTTSMLVISEAYRGSCIVWVKSRRAASGC